MIKLASHQVTEELALMETPLPKIKLAMECLVKSAELMETLGQERFAEEITKILEKIGEV